MTLDAEQRALVAQAAAWAPGGEGTTKISIEVAALFPKFGRFGSREGVVHTEGVFYTPGAYVPVQAAPLASHEPRVRVPLLQCARSRYGRRRRTLGGVLFRKFTMICISFVNANESLPKRRMCQWRSQPSGVKSNKSNESNRIMK